MSLFTRLKQAFTAPEEAPAGSMTGEAAVAALLVEVACMDRELDGAEVTTIRHILEADYGLTSAEIGVLMEIEAAREVHQLFPFVNHLNKTFDEDQRFEVIRQLWHVILADHEIDDRERQFMRRVAAMLHISDRDSGIARRAAAEALQAQ